MNSVEKTQKLKAKAQSLGFELSGAAPAVPSRHYPDFLDWLSKGYAGEMGYLERRKEERGNPQKVLAGAKSFFCVGLSYNPSAEYYPLLEKNPISCYAWGKDYHEVLIEKLQVLADYLRFELEPGTQVKSYVDTGPILEKDYAAAAGLGWIGKNTLLLNKKFGSFLFLGELITDTELAYDEPADNLCKTCTACMDACPVNALEEAGVLNANKCISYLTLEHRSDLPENTHLHGYLAGCDICQTVCPYNVNAPKGQEPAFQPRAEVLHLSSDSATMSQFEFKQFTQNSALERIKYPMWKRNLKSS
jgi:epoxyqueuosine reductase